MFFKTSTTWVVDYHFDGRNRRLFKIYPDHADVPAEAQLLLTDLYGGRAKLVDCRPATDDEERQFLRNAHAKNVFCPTGR